MTKKVFTLLMAVMLVFCYIPSMAFAGSDEAITKTPDAKFVDMPNDWSTTAIENAVANGLIKGYEGTDGLSIKPNGTLTRAEMATVVNRAFGAEVKASLSGANDIVSGAWYEAEMAKAVQMGTMKKDSQMRPNANITRQEACTILARAFKMVSADSAHAALNNFSDKNSVASWAQDSMTSLVEKGYMAGANGSLNPTANMTRAEFAKIMDNMVKQFVTTVGTIEKVAETGNVMVNVPGVTLKNVTINGNLIIGDGVGSGECTLDGVKVTGETIVRGGGVNSIIIKGDSNLGNVVVAKVDGNVRVAVEGNAKVSVVVVEDGKNDVKIEGKIGTLKVDSETPVIIQKAEIAKVEVTAANAAVTVAKDATVTTLKVEAAKADLKINGTVNTVSVEKAATGAKIAIAKDAKVSTLEANANVTTSGEGKPASVTGTGTVSNGTTTTKPSGGVSGGSGGSSSGGDTPTPQPSSYQIKIGHRTANITSLVNDSNAKFESGSYVAFTNLLINFAKTNATDGQKAKVVDILANAKVTEFTLDPSAHNSSLVDAYNAFLAQKNVDKLQALLLATATVLDKPTSTKEKIIEEYNQIAADIQNGDFEASYNGKTGTLTQIKANIGGTDYYLYNKNGTMNVEGFVNAVYGKKLTEVIGNSANVSVIGTTGAATVSYTAEIRKF